MARQLGICPVLILLVITGACSSADDPEKRPALGGVITDFEVYTDLPGYPVYRPVSAAVDSPFLFIADQGLHAVYVFDADLNLIRKIGRFGEGPGEFSGIADISVRDGTLAVLDGFMSRSNRIAFLDYEGRYRGGFRVLTRASDPPEVFLTDHGTVLIAKYRYNPAVEEYYTGSTGRPDTLLTEYDRSGAITAADPWQPGVRTFTEGVVDLIGTAGPPWLLFRHTPRLVRRGSEPIDWFWEIDRGFPIIGPVWQETLEERRAPTTRYAGAVAIFGGGVQIGDQLLVGGPLYNLAVIDLATGALHPVSLGRFGVELVKEGNHATWDDLVVLGDRVYLLSSPTAKLVVVSLSEVLAAAREGVTLHPLPKRPPGY